VFFLLYGPAPLGLCIYRQPTIEKILKIVKADENGTKKLRVPDVAGLAN
jgi:hypothetical protein